MAAEEATVADARFVLTAVADAMMVDHAGASMAGDATSKTKRHETRDTSGRG
jgi:hypothetical protein